MSTDVIVLGRLSLQTPVWTVAPMVTQCDAPFRLLTRRYGARLVYSEMLMADKFADDPLYRRIGLGLLPDGRVPEADHPLIVQFAANDPATLLSASLAAQNCGADAIDINLGCPQNRAREGHFGSFLTDPPDWPLCCEMVRTCVASSDLKIPITCKIRLQPTVAATIEFTKMLEDAGCAMIAVHGRKRGNENQRRSGPADLDAIRAVKAALGIPVLTNGNVSSFADALESLRITGADGVMSAEQILRDPALFARCNLAMSEGEIIATETELLPNALELSNEYLSMCAEHVPTSVWEESVWEDADLASCDVVRHHLSRMLQNLHGTGNFLSLVEYLTAKSIREVIHLFRNRFDVQLRHSQLQDDAKPIRLPTGMQNDSEESDDDADECLIRLAAMGRSKVK